MEEEKQLREVVDPTAIPHIYVNGFQISITNADFAMILEQNGMPVAIVNMSYTIGKTFATKIGGLLEKIEGASDRPIMTTVDMDGFIRKIRAKPEGSPDAT